LTAVEVKVITQLVPVELGANKTFSLALKVVIRQKASTVQVLPGLVSPFLNTRQAPLVAFGTKRLPPALNFLEPVLILLPSLRAAKIALAAMDYSN
jgi:hypothetical protein